MSWAIGIIVLIIFGFILDREIYFYEGAHLGPRVQAYLYDRWSRKYDVGKRESQIRDNGMLARPLLEKLTHIPQPFILDFATGTGRLSFVLLNQRDFKGHIIALDLSLGMLEKASAKIEGIDANMQATHRIEFLRHPSLPLPFPDQTFDVVCCLEVLELFPNMDDPLKELTRVLRPGGIMLTSRGTEESGRRAKVKSKSIFESLLEKYDLINVEIIAWWKLFDRVFAQKRGLSAPVGQKKLSEVMMCGKCKQVHWQKEANALTCQNCRNTISITDGGIVLG